MSTWLFFQVTNLPALQGVDDQVMAVAISFAWILIFPAWIILFISAMAVLDIIARRQDR